MAPKNEQTVQATFMRIAIFLPNWIGDAVMATPAVRALRDAYPGARMIGVMKPYIAGVFEGCPWFDEQVFLDSRGPWRQRWPGVALRLRGEAPDLAVLFPNSFRSALVAWLAGARRRIGYDRYGRAPLLSEALEPVRDAEGRLTPSPVIDAYNLLAARAGACVYSYRMELFTTPRDEAAAAEVWQQARFDENGDGPVVCLNPGAAFGSAKYWSADAFATLAQKLVDTRGEVRARGVLVLCGPSERELAREITDRAGRPNVVSLAGHSLSIGLTKACVCRADLLITTDSGPRHFAAAFGRPVVTLFGPTHIAWTETYYSLAVHLQKPVECGPCQLRTCPIDHRCMKLLTPSEVFDAAVGLLRRVTPSQRDAAA
jgi:heptosyltransferase-2